MTNPEQLNTQRNMALVAGGSLVAMALLAGWGYGYIFACIYVPGDALQTATNLAEGSLLFRWFIAAFMGILLLDVVVAWALYYVFKAVNEPLALLTAWLRVAYAAFLGMALQQLLPLLSSVAPEPGGFALHCLNAFLAMWSLGLLVFGSHMLLLGWLLLQARFVPKVIGLLILLGAVCYVATNGANLLLPDYGMYKAAVEQALSLPMALSELGLAGWLLAKGGRQRTAMLPS